MPDVTLNQRPPTTTNPATQTFDFLKSISLYLATDAAGTAKVLLAPLSPVPTGPTTITTISLPPGGNKPDAYLRRGSYPLFTTAELTQPRPQSTTAGRLALQRAGKREAGEQ